MIGGSWIEGGAGMVRGEVRVVGWVADSMV